MPHALRESHLEELCGNCKKPHGDNVELLHQHHKVYNKLTCENCGYVTLKKRDEKEYSDRYAFM